VLLAGFWFVCPIFVIDNRPSVGHSPAGTLKGVVAMDLGLSGKTALITGGSMGIGLSAAIAT